MKGKSKKLKGYDWFDVVNVIFLTLFTLSIVYPFVYMFSISISDPYEVGLMNVKLLPKGFNLLAYQTVFKDKSILLAYYNSIRYTVVGTIVTLLMNSLAAYALSRPNFRTKNFFVIVFTIPMFFNGGMIPNFLNIRNLHLLDTMWAVIFPAVGMWNIILLRTNFKQIPASLSESAFMDGANDWYIFFKVILPLSKSILATIAVFAAVGYWNNYFTPLLYLSDPDMAPLPIILRRILVSKEVMAGGEATATLLSGASDAEKNIMTNGMYSSLRMATIFVTIGPIILVYPFAQKYFVKGVMVGSIKG